MTLRLTISILGLTACAALGQDNVILFRTGISTFYMERQKTFQKDFRTSTGLPVRVVHEFEPFLSFGGTLGLKVGKRTGLGAWFEYSSTGGRVHYGDYSGEVYMDQILRCRQWGIALHVRLNNSSAWQFFATLSPSRVKTRETVVTAITVGGNSDSETLQLQAASFAVRPGLILQKTVRFLVFQGSIGYDFHTYNELKTSSGQTFIDPGNGDVVTAQWRGLRAGLSAGFLLRRPSH